MSGYVCTYVDTVVGSLKGVATEMFSKKKKKPQISTPTNFEHRVHTGFDKREGKYVGLPLQWASIVGNNQILKSTNRPLPLVDPSEITPTEILDLKTIVRGDHKSENRLSLQPKPTNGIVLPKTSNVARSNSLRSSSPPRIRRERNNANVPPAVPEEQIMQYPSMRRDPSISKPQVRDQSPAERSLSNHDVHNGNVQEPHYPYPREQTMPPQPNPIGLQLGHSHGSQQSLQHTYPPRPDQNQNVKNGAVGHVPGVAAGQTATNKHHEQRLTHEQVSGLLLFYLLKGNYKLFIDCYYAEVFFPHLCLFIYILFQLIRVY